MAPTDSICKVKMNISTKKRQKSLCKKVNKSDGTNTVFSDAIPSTLISQHCFLRIWVKQSAFLWIAKQQLRGKQIKFYLLLDRLCIFFVVVSRELYVKLFITILL